MEEFSLPLAIMVYEPLYHALLTNVGSIRFLGRFYVYFSLVFYILGFFKKKKL